MRNPPNGTAPKSFDTNKKNHDILAGKNNCKIVTINPCCISTYTKKRGAFFWLFLMSLYVYVLQGIG